MFEIVTVETPELGNRAYLVHDGEHALVVDPPRDIDRIERTADDAGVRVAAVAETHVHNDYVSGGPALASRRQAEYVVAAAERVDFARTGVRGGDVFGVGELSVEVIETPGHTAHHLAYLARSDDAAPALFSGGSLLFGTVGRTDLAGPEHTEALTRQQHRSAHLLAERLAANTTLHPTHGFGSFCATTAASSTEASTLAQQLLDNDALTIDDEDVFVGIVRAALGPFPAYYAHMAALNRAGHGRDEPPEPRRLDAAGLRAAVDAGAWVVDLRGRGEFASGHLPGSLSFEHGNRSATYVGWVLPWESDIVLLANSPERLAAAGRDLARIGIDRLAGVSLGLYQDAGPEVRSYPVRRWEDLPAATASAPPDAGRRGLVVLDVRQRAEYDAGHLRGALHIPIQDVRGQVDLLPPGQIWVHCASGYRAAIAASLLQAAGRDVVLVDDQWDRAAGVGLPIETGSPDLVVS